MNAHESEARLRTCPDCGGILELKPPGWIATFDLVSALPPERPALFEWQCLICGFSESPSVNGGIRSDRPPRAS